MTMLRKLLWKLKGNKHIDYSGFMCGCCGRWWNIRQHIPIYQSAGEWWDTIGLCPNGLCRFGEDDPITLYEKVAIERLYNGIPYECSIGIDDTITYGYGDLDDYGFWKLPLQKSWIDDYKQWKSCCENN